MEFCPKCGMRLVIEQRTTDDIDSTLLVCPKCNYAKSVTVMESTGPKSQQSTEQEHIMVIGEVEAKIRTMPTTKVECPKCGNTEAYWWMVQTRGADESSTQFFRCTKCHQTWREMS